ncbi:Ig-like domain-containing protein [Nocardioides sp. 1609]|uniref:Ig-like domain-containing protein n=1 Tax=Nocardioides sp. 1609 TaxID=2508327 RepID=UPI00106F2114|nr:Ig-like domain-containing protein [Nocardioides sp. 1609]
MSISRAIRRHRVAIATNAALLVAATCVVVVATQADGYRKHEAQLNDGGIWVTNGRDGYHGRVNKPIGELDGVTFAEQDAQLDVVQDGAAVLGIDVSAGVVSTIDPAKVSLPDGENAALPAAAQVQLAGGSLAVLDPADGSLWATRVDTRRGVPPVAALDSQADPLAVTAPDAALAVTVDGGLVVASAEDDVLRTFAAGDGGFGAPSEVALGADLGRTVAVTTVGERAVVLDTESGALQVVGGADADLPAGSVLQVPGPDADVVLVATPDRLVGIDLATGAETEVVADAGGRPTAPVRLGACVYGAWSGGFGAVATVCGDGQPNVDDLGTETSDLVFRVNRGEILLNDRGTGAVWNIDSDQPTRLDNWDAFQLKPDKSDDDNQNENTDDGDRRPPEAKDDALGARVGRTTVLHPLDNDTAPGGRLLAISGVEPPRGSEAAVTVSPDGQTVQIDLPEGSGPTRFDYTIDDGRTGLSDTATVTVTPRTDAANATPQLREGFEPRVWAVPAGGTLDIPVLPDWRDKEDGDPLALDGAVAVGGERSGAVARTTSAGRVRFTAPAESGVVTVTYSVTDGIGAPVEDELEFQVQSLTDRKSFPGVAEPDVVSGEVGRTVTIRPLGNDLPGSDPITPTARTALAGKVAQPAGTEVTTDLVDGTISFTATQARTYFLDYDLRFGNAPFAPGRIRVDVKAPDRPPKAPVAMPDSVTLHGQAATLVDVVANDIDPTGGVLVVQGAAPDAANALDVAVVEGRWLRIAARQGRLDPNPQLVRYTVSNGARSGVQGEVVVAWRPAPDDNTPVTETDRVVVRAGGGVSVPVLDNDFSPAGDELELVGHGPGGEAGVLEVRPPGEEDVPTGQAFVTDRFVRYVAPDGLEDAETFTVRYLATNTTGDRAPGTLEIQVVPSTRRNEPPEPPVLEGRAVAGDTIKLRIPGAGVDPDGDPVTLTGIDSAPSLGRVVRFGASSIVYQAYPGSVGTDEFGYTVADPNGGSAAGTVRIAVVPPGTPQPPLAVPDTVTTEPGRLARVDILANDYVAAGDRVEATLVDPPAGVSLETPQGPIVIEAPDTLEARTLQVVYRLSNGLDASQTSVTLRLATPYNNPPVVFDAYGTPADEGAVDGAGGTGDVDGRGDASTVTVDVLETAYDPDGEPEDLRVSKVFAPQGTTATIAGGEVTVQRGAEPMVVPFRVRDADGGAATGSIYVPPVDAGAPYVVPGASIEVDPGETESLDLADYVVNPGGGPVQFTLQDRIWASPEGDVQPTITDDGAFDVAASDRYEGPGAVVFEVTTGDGVDDPDGIEATLSVPVQVGRPRPVLRCPDTPVRIAQDRTIGLDVASFCHVWTPDPEDVDSLSFDADWQTSVDGLSIVQPSGSTIEVNAAGNAAVGSRATLQVTAEGSEPGLVQLLVVESPPPSMSPVRLEDMRAGEERTIDLAPYLRAGVPNPEPEVLEVAQVGNLDVQATSEGSRVTITTGPEVDGRAELRVLMSDVTGSNGPERQVEGRITFDVLDVPDVPTAPVPGTTVRDQEVALGWRAPDANGAPIDRYEVRGTGGVGRECGGTSCDVTGLTNGQDYRFEVRAHNAVGWSGWSPQSRVATPDAKPGRVGPIQVVAEGDTSLRLRWTPPTTQTSDIREYVVSWDDGGSTTTRRPEVTVTGLDNNQRYTFTVYAVNERFAGERRSGGPYQSVGTPAAPAAPTLTENRTSSRQTAVIVSWPAVDPNGPTPLSYTVLRDGSPLPACTDQAATSCVDGGIGYDGRKYRYAVRVTNKGGAGRTATGPPSEFVAVGDPEAWGDWSVTATGQDNQSRADFTVPVSNGAESRVKVIVGTTVVEQFQGAGGQSRTVTVPNNDGAHQVRLEVCNELDRCSPSAPRSVQTYGPLGAQHIVSMTSTRGDVVPSQEIGWRITVDPNGDPATVRVTSNQGRDETITIPGVDTYTFDTQLRRIGYDTTETITVRLSDAAPARGPATRTAESVRTDQPLLPSVEVTRGDRCSDRAGSSLPNCYTTSGTVCTHASCGYITIIMSNFSGSNTYCTIDSSTGGGFGRKGPFGDGSHQTGAYYGNPGGWVSATCGGATSPRYTWPGS